MTDEDFEKIIEKLEAEREELIECNEQFSVDNQNLKYQRDKAWQNILHWRNKSFELEEKLAVMTAERDEALKRAAHVEKMWGEAEVKLWKAVEALKSALRFIEKTERESGVILGCGDKSRATLAEIKSSKAAPPYGLEGETHE